MKCNSLYSYVSIVAISFPASSGSTERAAAEQLSILWVKKKSDAICFTDFNGKSPVLHQNKSEVGTSHLPNMTFSSALQGTKKIAFPQVTPYV